MPEFAGFNEWIEIFRGGKQVDSNGRSHDGDALIDRAVSQFNAAAHEPPLVVGHPKENSPAFGWVEGLKSAVQGGSKVLLAKCKQVVPEFAGLVQQGVYKKRSAAFYPDGSLRHVGFLGGMPPAVKGLTDIGFAEAAESVFEFNESPDTVTHTKAKEAGMKFSEFMEIFKFWKQVENDPAIELPKPAAAAKANDADKTFSEAEVKDQVDAAKKQAETDARKAVESEFAEKSRKDRLESRQKEIKGWCDGLLKAGKLTPAIVKAGFPELALAFAEIEEPIEFGEKGQKATRLDIFKSIWETELPKLIDFNEIATRDKDVSGTDMEKRQKLVTEFMEKNPNDTMRNAMLFVSKEHPELFKTE